MSNKTVVIEISVNGIPTTDGDYVFKADTELTESQWNSLTEDEQDRVVHGLYCEEVNYGWHVVGDEHEED